MFQCSSLELDIQDAGHVKKLITGWENIRKKAKPKRKTGIGGVATNTNGSPLTLESDKLLLEIFGNKSLPDGATVITNYL